MHRFTTLYRFSFLTVAMVALAALSACQTSSIEPLNFLKAGFQSGPEEGSFEAYALRGYNQLAEYEEYWADDPDAAAHFRAKADQIKESEGAGIKADDPASRKLAKDDMKEAAEASRHLSDALKMLKSKDNNLHLAEAMVNYDCWLERMEDRYKNTKGGAHEQFCRARFYAALGSLVLPDESSYSIYFDSNATVINDQGRETLDRIAENYPEREFWRVHLTGHTDSKGDYNANVILSMRRAVAVRNALAQRGVARDKIIIDAVGETGLRAGKNKSNKSGDKQARRVDVDIMPAYLHLDIDGPNIKKILPQHFDGNAIDR